MALTPDDIAHRAFSPSVDGYHQGEVRTYLERIASQLRALKAVQTEGIEPLADLHMRLERYEPQLAHLEQGLGSVLAELQSTAAGLAATQAAQHRAMAQLAEAQRLATEQLEAATSLITEQRAAAERVVAKAPPTSVPADNGQSGPSADQLAADQQAANERASAQRAATEAQLATAQRAAAEESAAQAAALKATEAARAAAEKQAAADKAIAEAQVAVRRAADAAPSANVSLTTIDLPKEMQTPPPLTLDLDIDTSPRISNNAHELLDGVLDDVLQDLNDEGPSSS